MLLLAGCAGSGAPLKLAPQVDLARYWGRWFIVAEIPYAGERGNVGNVVDYTPLPDGHIRDVYDAHEKSFDGQPVHLEFDDRVVDGSNGALWRVRLFWPLFVSYPIIDVDPDYRISLVGYPDRSLGWVFARTPDISDAAYAAALQTFATQGYDVSKFRRVPQRPEQIGQPGFE